MNRRPDAIFRDNDFDCEYSKNVVVKAVKHEGIKEIDDFILCSRLKECSI